MLGYLKKLLQNNPHAIVSTSGDAGQHKPLSVTIGLDFGTCATKCVVNLEGAECGRDKFLAIAFPSETSRLGVLCVPTAIGVHDGNLHFCGGADHLREDCVIRSFKMAIPCIGTTWGAYRCPLMLRDAPGHFEICGRHLSASDLAAMYLAVILRQIRQQVSQHVGRKRDMTVFLNLAAPLNQLVGISHESCSPGTCDLEDEMVRDTAISREYIALGQRSLFLSECCQNPWPVEEAVDALKRAKEQPILTLEDSPAYVVPETLAAIAGYVNRPGTLSGRFMTLDVGAGSTDVSVFWLEKHGGKIKPWYYASRSLHVGMDAIDRDLEHATRSLAGGSLRARRESLQRSDGSLGCYRQECQDTIDAIDKHRRTTFGYGYSKEKCASIWGDRHRADIVLLMIGGGCAVDLVQDVASADLWNNVIGKPDVEMPGLDVTKYILGPDGREHKIDELSKFEEHLHLLIIAEGLAHKIVDIPEWEVSKKQLITRKRCPIPPELWWSTGRDDAW